MYATSDLRCGRRSRFVISYEEVFCCLIIILLLCGIVVVMFVIVVVVAVHGFRLSQITHHGTLSVKFGLSVIACAYVRGGCIVYLASPIVWCEEILE